MTGIKVGTSTRNLMKQERVYARGARVITRRDQAESASSASWVSSFLSARHVPSLAAVRPKLAPAEALPIDAALQQVVVLELVHLQQELVHNGLV